jgi:chromosome segregation ATPase
MKSFEEKEIELKEQMEATKERIKSLNNILRDLTNEKKTLIKSIGILDGQLREVGRQILKNITNVSV